MFSQERFSNDLQGNFDKEAFALIQLLIQQPDWFIEKRAKCANQSERSVYAKNIRDFVFVCLFVCFFLQFVVLFVLQS